MKLVIQQLLLLLGYFAIRVVTSLVEIPINSVTLAVVVIIAAIALSSFYAINKAKEEAISMALAITAILLAVYLFIPLNFLEAGVVESVVINYFPLFFPAIFLAMLIEWLVKIKKDKKNSSKFMIYLAIEFIIIVGAVFVGEMVIV